MGKNKDTKKRERRRMTAEELAARHKTPMLRNAFARVSALASAETRLPLHRLRLVWPRQTQAPRNLWQLTRRQPRQIRLLYLLVDKYNNKRGRHDGFSKYCWLVECICDAPDGGGIPRADGRRGCKFRVRASE